MFGISDIAETVAMRKEIYVEQQYTVCEIRCDISGHL